MRAPDARDRSAGRDPRGDPWEKRGLFLAWATEALRLSEAKAYDLDDYRDGKVRLRKSQQGSTVDARIIARNKNLSDEWRRPWHSELQRWIEWRVARVHPSQRLRGEAGARLEPDDAQRGKAVLERPGGSCVGECVYEGRYDIPLQQGTRHTMLTALGQVLRPLPPNARRGPLPRPPLRRHLAAYTV